MSELAAQLRLRASDVRRHALRTRLKPRHKLCSFHHGIYQWWSDRSGGRPKAVLQPGHYLRVVYLWVPPLLCRIGIVRAGRLVGRFMVLRPRRARWLRPWQLLPFGVLASYLTSPAFRSAVYDMSPVLGFLLIAATALLPLQVLKARMHFQRYAAADTGKLQHPEVPETRFELWCESRLQRLTLPARMRAFFSVCYGLAAVARARLQAWKWRIFRPVKFVAM